MTHKNPRGRDYQSCDICNKPQYNIENLNLYELWAWIDQFWLIHMYPEYDTSTEENLKIQDETPARDFLCYLTEKGAA